MTDREMLQKLARAADEVLEYNFPNRVAVMMDVTLEALEHIGEKPLGWGSALASLGMSRSKYGKEEEKK